MLLDALVFAESSIFFHETLKARFGFSYLMFGLSWKAKLYRFGMGVVAFVVGWILPAVIGWLLSDRYPQGVGWSLVLYYGGSILLVLWRLFIRARFRFQSGQWPGQRVDGMLTAMSDAYYHLREETIHVPSLSRAMAKARDAGVAWPPQALVLLDSSTAKFPSKWNRRL